MTAQSDALDWLEALPAGAYFRRADVPAPATTVYPLLSRLVRDPDDIRFARVAPGLYFKGDPSVELRGWGCSDIVAALLYAGEGAGLGMCSAIHRLGWSTQHPIRLHVVTQRPVRPWHSELVYEQNPNKRRRELNWTEVTLLEALHDLVFIEDDWQLCLRRLREGWILEWLPWQSFLEPAVRTDLMLWVAAAERWDKRRGCRSLSELQVLIEEVGEAANAERPEGTPRPSSLTLSAPMLTSA